jgi:hypothetical protein
MDLKRATLGNNPVLPQLSPMGKVPRIHRSRVATAAAKWYATGAPNVIARKPVVRQRNAQRNEQ